MIQVEEETAPEFDCDFSAWPVANDSTVWPAKLPPVVCAAIANPKTASLIFNEQLICLHRTSNLGILIGLAVDLLTPGSLIIRALQENYQAAPHVVIKLEALFFDAIQNLEKIQPCEAGSSAVIFQSVDTLRAITVEVRNIRRSMLDGNI